jgi:hypothetical protein
MLGDIGSKFDHKGFSDEKPEIVPQIPFALGLAPIFLLTSKRVNKRA